MPNQPSNMSPFRNAWRAYFDAGWYGPLPLPPKKKNPPPTGYTGHAAPWPGRKLKEWHNDPKYRRGNICLRIAAIKVADGAQPKEVVGIDVDHYLKGDKDKRGGDQLKALEEAYGNLPDTWISSARTDGVSGIRYYLVPRGLTFRGQVDKDIECISKGYRFAVVWPSTNPDADDAQYWWYPPGVAPTVEGRSAWSGELGDLPKASELPELPDAWIDHLSRGRMAAGDTPIDMDSSAKEIYQWAYDTFGVDQAMCYRVREKKDKHLRLIREEATSHDKIVNAHMNILRLAEEGHTGWDSAIHEIEEVFTEVCTDRDKRSLDELRGEIFRSRINGLRKVKASIDAKITIGAAGVPDRDMECGNADDQGVTLPVIGGPPTDGMSDISRGPMKPTPEYDTNDDGNAAHFADMFSNNEIGPVVRFVEGYGWIVWHNGDSGQRQPHWELDVDGTGIIRRMWWEVKKRQVDYADACKADYENKRNAFANQQPGTSKADVEAAKALYNKWNKFAENSGNNRQAANAIEAVKSVPGVRIKQEQLDASPDLLGVANGVVELNYDGPVLRRAQAEDYITLNTGVEWVPANKLSHTGQKLWYEYLDKFLPDKDYRKDVQIALGHCLLGGNPHKKWFVFKGFTNTGKSVMISMINAVLGDYAATVSKTMLQTHKLNPVLAQALPKRITSIVEVSSNGKDSLGVDEIKTGTGGDVLQVELKGSNVTVSRVPFFVPITVTNTVPHIQGADKALKERLHVIEFNVVEEHPDDTIAARMRTESKTAVLAWLLEGYKQYCALGRRIPENASMKEAKEEFAADFDETSRFVADRIEIHSHHSLADSRWQDAPEWCSLPSDIYQAYRSWALEAGVNENHIMTQHKFTLRLKELGFMQKQIRPTKGMSARHWLGIRLTGNSVQRRSENAVRNVVDNAQTRKDT